MDNEIFEIQTEPINEPAEPEPVTYYAMTDERDRVVDIRTSKQISNVNPDVWHIIEDGGEYMGRLSDGSVCRYKLVDGVMTERTAEEMAEDIPEPSPDFTEMLRNSAKSSQYAFCKFDGLKYIADPEHPIPLELPMAVIPNMIYLYGGVRYVALEDTTVTENNFADVMAEY